MRDNSSWLDRVMALFGDGRSAPTWRERGFNEPLSDQERFLIASLPFHRRVVPGAEVLATWERLRVAGEGYPVLVGDNDSLLRLVEGLAFDDRQVGDILVAAGALRMPQAMAALRRREHEQALAYLRDLGQISEPEDFYEPPLGEWPEDESGLAQAEPLLATDILAQQPLEGANILIIPAASGVEVPAHLRYGAWNACPRAEYHVAMLRSWHERYGAELVSMGADTVELRVKRRPGSREEALALAREHYAYCSDTVDQGTMDLATLAANLMASDWWYFWWD